MKQLDKKEEQINIFKSALEDEQSKKEEYQVEIASLHQKISDLEEDFREQLAQAAANHDAKSSSSSSSKSSKSEKKASPKASNPVLNE